MPGVAMTVGRLAVIAVVLLAGCGGRDDTPADASDEAASTDVAEQAPTPAEPTPAPTFAAVVDDARADLREMPEPLPPTEAAVYTLRRPVHLARDGTLWVQHPDGRTVADVVRDVSAPAAAEYVVRDDVVATLRRAGGGGRWIEVIARDADGRVRWHHPVGVSDVPGHAFDWQGAVTRGGRVAVPTADGVVLLSLHGVPGNPLGHLRRYAQLANRPATDGHVRVVATSLDGGVAGDAPTVVTAGAGFLAWHPEGTTAAYADGDGMWQTLGASAGWTRGVLATLAYADGSIVLIPRDGQVRRLTLNAADLDVDALVAELGRMKEGRRRSAADALQAAGPGVADALRERRGSAGRLAVREIDAVLEHLDASQREVRIANAVPQSGEVTQVWSKNGAMVLRFDGGVLVDEAAGIRVHLRPAYLAADASMPAFWLNDALRREAEAGAAVAAASGELLLRRPGQGWTVWGVNHFAPLGDGLPGEAVPLGRDSLGRWLFESAEGVSVLDPHRRPADAPPPMFTLRAGRGGPLDVPGTGGRGPEGFPAYRLGGTWQIDASGWAALDRAASIATRGMPEPVTLPDGRVVRVGDDGITVPTSSGDVTVPGVFAAAGAEGDALVFAADDQVVRVRPDGSRDDFPLPHDRPPTLVWTDPAGRICVAYGDDAVTLIYPDGVVPASMRSLMPRPPRPDAEHNHDHDDRL